MSFIFNKIQKYLQNYPYKIELAHDGIQAFKKVKDFRYDLIFMDMAMPSMVLGVIFCDRYKLDSALYAMIVTITTALSLISLPLWHNVLIHEFVK